MLNQNDAQQLVVLLQMAQMAQNVGNKELLDQINAEALKLWQDKNDSVIVDPKTIKIHEAKFE